LKLQVGLERHAHSSRHCSPGEFLSTNRTEILSSKKTMMFLRDGDRLKRHTNVAAQRQKQIVALEKEQMVAGSFAF